MGIFGRIGNDIIHPFGLGNAPQPAPQPVRTPAPMQQAAPRPVVRTPAPISQGQPGFGVMRPGIAPMAQPHFTQPQVAQMRQQPAPQRNGIQELGHAVSQVGKAAGLGLARAGAGIGQDVSGLVDLATPGTGTSRVTKGLVNAGASLDKQAAQIHGPAHAGYQIGQVAGNIASFIGPGELAGAAKGTALGTKLAAGTGRVVNPTTKLVEKGAEKLATRGAPGRIAAQGLRGVASPAGVINAGVGTAQSIGNTASKGQDVNAKNIAGAAAMNLGMAAGIPMAAQVAKEAAPAVVKGAKALSAEQKAAGLRMNTVKASNNEKRAIQTELKGVNKQLNSLPVTPQNARGVNVLMGKQDVLQSRLAQNRLQHGQIQNPVQKVTDRVLTAQPGLSMKEVHDPAPEPSSNDLMKHFSDMRKQYGNDAEFFDKVVLNNQDAPGMIGQLSRSIASTDAREGGKSYPISAILDDHLTPVDTAAQGQNLKDAHLNDLKAMTRKLERDTGQKGLYSNAAKAMQGMSQDEQIAYLSKGMTGARDSGALAAAHINTQNGYRPQPTASPIGIEAPTAPVKTTTPEALPPHEAVPQPAPEAAGTGGESLPNNTPQIVQNRFTKGAKQGKQAVSDDLAKSVQGEHAVRNTAAMGDQASADVDKMKLPDAVNAAHDKLSVPLGSASDADHAFAIRAIERADEAAQKAKASGDKAGYETNRREAAQLHDDLSKHLTAKGQGAQIAALLYSKTPQGMYYKAEKVLKNAGHFDEAKGADLQAMVDKIKGAADDATKQDLTAQFHKKVSDMMPQSLSRNLLGVWKAGLLSGTKTIAGNPLSNETFYAMKEASDPLSVMYDKGLKLAGKTGVGQKLGLKGERSYTTSHVGVGSGTKEGFKGMGKTLKTGIDSRDVQAKVYENSREINFNNKTVQKFIGGPSNSVFRIMGGADQPVFYRTLKQELGRQAKVDAMNSGIKGAERNVFVKKAMLNPSTEAMQTATDAAWKSVLGQDTKVGSAVSDFTRKVPAMQAVIPFTKVPTNFISRTLDYTPVGAVKGLTKAAMDVRKGQGINQRALSQALGEATTGSALLYVGKTLADHGLVTGQYPTDPKEQQRWRTEQIQPNSVKVHIPGVGTQYISMNYMGPLGLIFGAGKDYHDASSVGNNGAGAALLGAGKNLTGQSFLSGFSGLSNAINDPARSASSYVNSQVASVAPSWMNDIANLTDKNQRQADNPGQALGSRIPGLREQNKVKQDVYGNPLQQAGGQFNSVNPLKPSNDIKDKTPAVAEVNRLHNVDPNNKDLQVTPTTIDKKITIPAAKKGDPSISVSLNNQQRYDLQKQVGQNTQDKWNQLIKTPEYQAMSDTEKAKKLNDLRGDATELATRKYVVDNNLASYAKPASKSATALADGNMTKYTSGTSGNGVTVNPKIDPHSQKVLNEYNTLDAATKKSKAYKENDYDYKVAQAKYDNEVANGSLNKAQSVTRKVDVAKAKVGSSFSKDVRDLYGLSKSELADYLTSKEGGVDKQKLGDDLAKYDQALYDAGLSSSQKYKYGVITNKDGSLANTKSSGGSTSTRSAAISKAAVSYAGVGAGTKASSGKFRVPSLKTGMKSARPTIKSYKVPKSSGRIASKRPTSNVSLNAKLPRRSTLV